jgi:hypothetical protein
VGSHCFYSTPSPAPEFLWVLMMIRKQERGQDLGRSWAEMLQIAIVPWRILGAHFFFVSFFVVQFSSFTTRDN